ncbi:MAG: hypothetical protein GF347_05315 [Candidatus Moranbacteria bacterium]|nr:hypothetical protein [Candidatus Moranbacteria bacterium]
MNYKINHQDIELKNKLPKDDFSDLKALALKVDIAGVGKMIAGFIQVKPLIKTTPVPQLPLELAILNILEKDLDRSSNKDYLSKKEEPDLKFQKTLQTRNEVRKDKKAGQKETELKKTPKKKEKKNRNKAQEKETPELSEVVQAWGNIVSQIKEKNRTLGGVLQSCEIYSINDEGLIEIKVRHNFHKSILEDLKNKRLLASAFKEELDLDCGFCYLLEGNTNKDKNKNLKSLKYKSEAAKRLLDEFGGEIIE